MEAVDSLESLLLDPALGSQAENLSAKAKKYFQLLRRCTKHFHASELLQNTTEKVLSRHRDLGK